MPDFDRIRVLLHSDGLLHWEPGGIFRTTCDINIAYFPFDSQRCPLVIGAYSYHSTRMNISNASRVISTHDFRVNGEWHIISTSAEWGITILSPPGGTGLPVSPAQPAQPDYDGTGRCVISHVWLGCFCHFTSQWYWSVSTTDCGATGPTIDRAAGSSVFFS